MRSIHMTKWTQRTELAAALSALLLTAPAACTSNDFASVTPSKAARGADGDDRSSTDENSRGSGDPDTDLYSGGAEGGQDGDAEGGIDGGEDAGGGVDSGGDASCDMSADFIKLRFPKKIQDCIDDGKIYNFDSDKCFEDVTKAKSYDCTRSDIRKTVEDIMSGAVDFDIEIVKLIKEKKAKLVGCGERRDGNTIVFQSWVPPTDSPSCEFSGRMKIITECYAGKLTSSSGTGEPESTAEAVARCVAAE